MMFLRRKKTHQLAMHRPLSLYLPCHRVRDRFGNKVSNSISDGMYHDRLIKGGVLSIADVVLDIHSIIENMEGYKQYDYRRFFRVRMYCSGFECSRNRAHLVQKAPSPPNNMNQVMSSVTCCAGS
jgi:hypothetical protein